MAPFFYIHVMATMFMTGVIWLVQLVHYPSFRFVEPTRFADFCQFHQQAITWVVGPMMVLEMVSALFLFQSSLPREALVVGFFLLIGIWLSTFLLSVPLHNQLLLGWDQGTIERLVITNWPRTLMWTLRSLLMLYLLRLYV